MVFLVIGYFLVLMCKFTGGCCFSFWIVNGLCARVNKPVIIVLNTFFILNLA